jgi:hypothetical protein
MKLRHAILLAALLALLGIAADLPAQEPPPQRPIDADWTTRFEQTYGTFGLYCYETEPDSDEAASRINLQSLSLAWRRLRETQPDAPFDFQQLKSSSLMPELLPPTEGEEYLLDEETGLITSSLGPPRTLVFGAQLLLVNNRYLRTVLLRPTRAVRLRWKAIYEDPTAPLALRREIELREFYMRHHYSREVRDLLFIRRQLEEINRAAKLHMERTGLAAGEPLSIADLEAAGLLVGMRGYPKGARYFLAKAGDAPTCHLAGATHRLGDDLVEKTRRRAAEAALAAYPDYPPAIALEARLHPPAEGITRINRAIALWPEVPSLRLERLFHEANRGNFDAWPEDLDHLLAHFPAAPILAAIDAAASTGVAASEPSIHAIVATALADARPDLLQQQLSAMSANLRAGRVEQSQRLYDRLLAIHPGWGALFPPPAKFADGLLNALRGDEAGTAPKDESLDDSELGDD